MHQRVFEERVVIIAMLPDDDCGSPSSGCDLAHHSLRVESGGAGRSQPTRNARSFTRAVAWDPFRSRMALLCLRLAISAAS